MENTTPQEKVINALATAWNLFCKIPQSDIPVPDDTNDFRKCIHDAQRIMFTQWKLNEMKEKEIKESGENQKKTFQERIDEKEMLWREKNNPLPDKFKAPEPNI